MDAARFLHVSANASRNDGEKSATEVVELPPTRIGMSTEGGGASEVVIVTGDP